MTSHSLSPDDARKFAELLDQLQTSAERRDAPTVAATRAALTQFAEVLDGFAKLEANSNRAAVPEWLERKPPAPAMTPEQREARQKAWRVWRLSIGALAALLVVVFVFAVVLLQAPADRLVALDYFLAAFWKVFGLFVVGDVGETIADGFTIRRKT